VNRDLVRHSLFGATVVFGVVGAVGSLRSGELPGNGNTWSLGIVAIGFAALGWMTIAHRRDLRIGWVMLVGGMLSAAAFLTAWWSYQTLVNDPGSLPFGKLSVWLALWLSPLQWLLLFVAPLVLFPNGVPRSRRWRNFLIAIGSVIIATVVGSAMLAIPIAFRNPSELLDAPGVAASGLAERAIGLQAVGRLLGFLGAFVSIIGLIFVRRKSVGEVRRQYTTVLVGAVVIGASLIFDGLLVAISSQRLAMPESVIAFFWLAIPGTIAFAIARFGLYELQFLVSRSVLVLLSGISLMTVYFFVLVVGTRLLNDPTTLSVSSVLAAGVVVVASVPTVAGSRALIRRSFGRNADRSTIAERYGDILTSDESLPDDDQSGLIRIAATIRREFRLASVQLVIENMTPTLVGQPSERSFRVRLQHGTDQIGEMIVTARRGEALSGRDRRAIDEIGHYVAVTAEAIRMSEELQQAQLALENAHADERRRVRRDLHDGVGPTLATIRLKLTSLRRQLPENLSVDETIDQVSDAIRELRRVVDGLQPSTLEDLGLVPALRILVADTSETTSLNIAFQTSPDLPDFGPDIAATAYRVVAESLANVVRHSRATACTIHLKHHECRLDVDVSDNGIGFDPTVATGMGLRSIASRVAKVGGQVTTTSAIDIGTTISVRLPT
jgi:signal transduction histidine kinase